MKIWIEIHWNIYIQDKKEINSNNNNNNNNNNNSNINNNNSSSGGDRNRRAPRRNDRKRPAERNKKNRRKRETKEKRNKRREKAEVSKKKTKQKTGDLTRVAVANNQRNEITRSCVNEPAANEAYANEPSLSDRFSMASISHELHANQRLIRMQMRPFMNHQWPILATVSNRLTGHYANERPDPLPGVLDL